MKNLAIWGIVAGAAAATAFVATYKKKDGSRLSEGLMDSAKSFGNKLSHLGQQFINRLLHNVTGPNGEPVYLDMYDRQFYENQEGKRVYLDVN